MHLLCTAKILNLLPMKKSFLYFICIVSAMGRLLFGYDWVVIGGAKPFYELYFDIQGEPMLQGLAMSIALVGCLIGAMDRHRMARDGNRLCWSCLPQELVSEGALL